MVSRKNEGLEVVRAWLYEDVLEIRWDENHPGFKHFYMEPVAGRDFIL